MSREKSVESFCCSLFNLSEEARRGADVILNGSLDLTTKATTDDRPSLTRV